MPIADIAGRIARRDLPDRIPGTEIGPGKADGHHRNPGGLFEHGVVDRNVRRLRKAVLVKPDEIEIDPGTLDGILRRSVACGRQGFGLAEECVGADHEHAGVPIVAAGSEHFFGIGPIRLLNEARHGVHAGRQLGAGLHVAVAGFGAGGRNAKSDELATTGSTGSKINRLPISRVNIDRVIGGKNMKHRIGAELLACVDGGGGDCRHRVARHGLQQHAAKRNADLLRLLGDKKTVVGIGQHDSRRIT